MSKTKKAPRRRATRSWQVDYFTSPHSFGRGFATGASSASVVFESQTYDALHSWSGVSIRDSLRNDWGTVGRDMERAIGKGHEETRGAKLRNPAKRQG